MLKLPSEDAVARDVLRKQLEEAIHAGRLFGEERRAAYFKCYTALKLYCGEEIAGRMLESPEEYLEELEAQRIIELLQDRYMILRQEDTSGADMPNTGREFEVLLEEVYPTTTGEAYTWTAEVWLDQRLDDGRVAVLFHSPDHYICQEFIAASQNALNRWRTLDEEINGKRHEPVKVDYGQVAEHLTRGQGLFPMALFLSSLVKCWNDMAVYRERGGEILLREMRSHLPKETTDAIKEMFRSINTQLQAEDTGTVYAAMEETMQGIRLALENTIGAQMCCAGCQSELPHTLDAVVSEGRLVVHCPMCHYLLMEIPQVAPPVAEVPTTPMCEDCIKEILTPKAGDNFKEADWGKCHICLRTVGLLYYVPQAEVAEAIKKIQQREEAVRVARKKRLVCLGCAHAFFWDCPPELAMTVEHVPAQVECPKCGRAVDMNPEGENGSRDN